MMVVLMVVLSAETFTRRKSEPATRERMPDQTDRERDQRLNRSMIILLSILI